MSPTALSLTDDEIAARVAADRDEAAFEALMRRHNQRLFRVARAILADDTEAEDTLQDAYLDAYTHMGEFRHEARLTTWLTRIVVNHALMRLRRRRRRAPVIPLDAGRGAHGMTWADVRDHTTEPPSDAALRGEIRRVLEQRIDALPLAFRAVFVMREVEEMSVQDIADALGIPSATVRTRLFRARAHLRRWLARDLDIVTPGLFGFAGDRCNRIVAAVQRRLAAASAHLRSS